MRFGGSLSGTSLDVRDVGTGAPVIFIQTALAANELRPLSSESALDGYRRIFYHRRGYVGSSPVQ